MADAEERLAQLLDLANGLLTVGRALLGEEQQEQLIDLARQLLAVIRALIDLLDERLQRSGRSVRASVQSECAEPSQPHA
jgi:hypothetical protein